MNFTTINHKDFMCKPSGNATQRNGQHANQSLNIFTEIL